MVEGATEAREKATQGVRAIFDRYHALEKLRGRDEVKLFDHDCMSRVKLLDAGSEGTVLFRFEVTPQYANSNGVLHGGAYGVLFDMFTTTALGPIARPGYWEFLGGVTRTLSISYLRPVPIGSIVYFHSRVLQHGRTMALIKGEMTSAPSGGVVYATAEHHKVNLPIISKHKEVRVDWDDEMTTSEEERGSCDSNTRKAISKL